MRFAAQEKETMMRLPVGIQSFRKIIEGNYVYADKTREIYRLLQGGSYCFLSRPRRFGKSLLVDTMRELFLGHRELFEGLWIADPESDYDFEAHPVVRIDMTQVDASTADNICSGLMSALENSAKNEGMELEGSNPAESFRWLIEALAAKHGRRVVVLIDEYDKPIVDHINAPEKAQANREVLGNFYGVLKGQDANLHFVFLTGVSKFTKLSLFSKLNNLNDITLRAPHANICGITEAEFDTLFSAEINAITRERVFRWYDGFSWDGTTRVFNPFSLLSYLRDREFNSYWYSTGTPTFLAKVFETRPAEYADIQSVTAPLEGLYASIPYELHIGAEAFYHALFLAVMQFLGFRVLGEVSVARGRIDGVLERPNGKTYVIEFKYAAAADDAALGTALTEALVQIEARDYAVRYAGAGREVYKLGVAVADRGKVSVATIRQS